LASDRDAVPEGHTIHRAARDQRPVLIDRALRVTAPDGRHPDAADRLDGRRITAIDPVGKHLFYRFDGKEPETLHVHLALFGKLILRTGRHYPPPEPRGALRFRLDTGQASLDLHGCRTTELIDPPEVEAIKDRLGPDPLLPGTDPERAWARISRSRAPIAGLLMDQSVISGLGNIYRCEVLFRRRIDPHLPGRDLPRDAFDALWQDAKALLAVGVRYDRIITVSREYAKQSFGKTYAKLARRERWYVYKKPTCPFTGEPIEQYELANRTVYWSPAWQADETGGRPRLMM
jgi:formamidopyrimidine-DNA glycosylase